MAERTKRAGCPRVKRMDRAGRMQSAASTRWVETYSGNNLVRGYRRKYGVDLLTAIHELRLLGVTVPASYEAQVRAAVEESSRKRREAKQLLTDIPWDNALLWDHEEPWFTDLRAEDENG